MRTGTWLSVVILSIFFFGADTFSQAAAPMVEPKAPLQARPFNLRQVRLLEGPFRDAMERDRQYLHELESDRLLHFFRKTAGLDAPGEPYGGWEVLELRGHTMGHYLSACALMVAATGDEKLKAKADRIVAELARCQKAFGTSGYLSAYPEEFFDRLEARQSVWAPYYTLHKIYAGLIDMYVHCDNRQALEIARGMAAWLRQRNARFDREQMQRLLDSTEQGGINDAMANLYALTGDPQHLELSRKFTQRGYNDPLAQRQDKLKGLHVNSFVPNIVGTARLYELTGDRRDRDVARFFWHQVAEHRCYSTGGTSNYEYWRTDPDVLSTELSPESQESCCTYNMLKLTRHLFCWDPRAEYADYYERALLSGILATQDPESGMMMYYVAMNPGHFKVFNSPHDSFWCCTGSGMENHAKYGDSIYFHDDRTLYVNLFIASELNWPEKGLVVRQETKFPEEDAIRLTFRCEKPVELDLKVRYPYWAADGIEVLLDDGDDGRQRRLSVEGKPASYCRISRTWSDGDRLEVRLPMRLHLHRMPDDPTLVSVMYGPMVLGGLLGTEGISREMFLSPSQRARHRTPQIAVPFFVVEDDDPATWIEPVADHVLTFRTRGVGVPEDVTLVPFHRLFAQRYSIYWRLVTGGTPECEEAMAREKDRQRRMARTIDNMVMGDGAIEWEHKFEGERTRKGDQQGRPWRDAHDGGWFQYRMTVLPEEPVVLACTYWGSDDGGREFDILVDGEKLATVVLDSARPGEFCEVEYPLPEEFTRGKKTVLVKFQAHDGKLAGGLFGLDVLRAK